MNRKPAPELDQDALALRRRAIPSVEAILSSDQGCDLVGIYGRESLKRAVVQELAGIRGRDDAVPSQSEILARAEAALGARFLPSIRPVVNATGVIIHTNLGRSPISERLLERSHLPIAGYSNLEYDLRSGERGSRDEHLTALASELFGCEAAILTNNNAAATLLVLAAIASGRKVVVSRGELVEIGGGFRIPEVIQQGGAELHEVGTTNRTRASDYSNAVDEETAALLRVNRSNFEIVGFTESPSLDELVAAARAARIPLLYDEGSGCVVDLARYGFRTRPTLREVLAAGVDIVTCSTDKLIGATQGGLILGSRQLVDLCRRHPLMRALRAGKESYTLIEETLRVFLAGSQEEEIPIYRMLATPLEKLRERAERIAAGGRASVCQTESALGGGTTPGETIPSTGVRLHGNAESVHKKLRDFRVPIIGRVQNGEVTLDLRTVLPREDELIAEVLSL